MKRTDENQPEIVKTLRQLGLSVAVTSNTGNGFPDIVTGGPMPCPHCGKKFPQNKLVEIKTEKGKLTDDQKTFHSCWRGNLVTVYSVEQAIEAHGILLRNFRQNAIKSDKQLLQDMRRTLLSQQSTISSMLANIDLQLKT